MARMITRGRSVGSGWQAVFWTAALAITILLLWTFSAVLPPFVAALVLGYLLDPVVGRMERFGLGRTWAATIIILGSILVLVLLGALITPLLGRQVTDFIKSFPDLVNRAQALASSASDEVSNGTIGSFLKKVGLDVSLPSELKKDAGELAQQAAQWAGGFTNSILSHGAAVLDILSWIVITPVVAFYLLLDWPKMLGTIDGLVPPRHRETVWGLAREIDLALAGFLRGQSLVCLFLAVWYGLGLSLIGLNFGLLIGIIGGILSFVPYVGSLIVLVISVLIAIVQGWPNWHLLALTLGIVLVGQFLEGNVLSPKLVGDKVGLHPVWLIFALLAFGSVAGFTGLLIAVPVAAAAGVLLRFATRRYKESPLYSGEPTPSVVVSDETDLRGVA